MPFKRRGSCIFHWRGRACLTIWDRVKIPRYNHRLMHQKRVTCELHDSYFRFMTIKHHIPKIEWTIELLYNSVRTGSQSVWSSESLEARCGRESQHPAEIWAPVPPVEQPWRTGKNTDSHKSGEINMLRFCSVSNSLSHTSLSNKVRGIYFFKRTVSLVFIMSLLWFCMHISIQHVDVSVCI